MLPEKIESTKAKIDEYLKELAKEFRKTSGSKASAEIILIGGASIVINYNFRKEKHKIPGRAAMYCGFAGSFLFWKRCRCGIKAFAKQFL